MKHILSLSIATAIAMATASCGSENDLIAFSELPQTTQQFINAHFSESDVRVIFREKGSFKTDYEVCLFNATTIDFDGDGELSRIEFSQNTDDADIVPQAIKDYVANNFQGNSVCEYTLKGKKQLVKLSNNNVLMFDRDGNFLGLAE